MQLAPGGKHYLRATRRKAMLLLKLAVFFMLAATVPICTPALTQRVTITGKDLRLEQVFAEIRKQTGLEFFYETTLLKAAHPISPAIHDRPVEEVLKECLGGQGMDFTIRGGTVIIFATRRN